MSSILPSNLSSREQEHLWKEYHALEARIQNDSRVAYTIVGVLVAAGFTLLGTSLAGFAALNSDISNPDVARMLDASVFGIAALLVIQAANIVLQRFTETGYVRQARAVQIECQLGIHSFRLFKPWVRSTTDVPDGYFDTLGIMTWQQSAWARTQSQYWDHGIQKHHEITAGTKFSQRMVQLRLAAVVILVAVVVFDIAHGIIRMLLE